MLMISSFSLIAQMNNTIYNSISNSVLLNTNNKIPFSDILIDTNNSTLTISPYQKSNNTNSCNLNFKREWLEQYEIAIIKNLIYRSKLMSFFKTIQGKLV